MGVFKRLFYRVMHQSVVWTGAGLLCASAPALLYALLRYHSAAPSLFYQDSALTVSWGIWLCSSSAALMFYLFGIGAWLVPIILGYAGLLVAGRYAVRQERMRMVAFVCLLCALSLWGALGTGFQWHDMRMFGGLLGAGLRVLIFSADIFVARVCALFIMSISFVLITRLAFLHVLVRAVRSALCFCKRYRVVQKIGYIFVGVVLYVKKVFGGFFNFSHRMIYPAHKEHDEYLGENEMGDRVSIDALVHDTCWQSYRTRPAKKEPASTSTSSDKNGGYQLPPVNLFAPAPEEKTITTDVNRQARVLEEKLAHFGIQGRVSAIKSGPLVTCFEYEPAIDTKLSKIIALEQDLALALQAVSIRIVAPIPGTSVVGFEVARIDRQTVYFSSLMHNHELEHKHVLPLVLGVDLVGNPVCVDVVSLPHLLIAGSTGSGKSVALHTMILSLLLHKSPDELKLILIDPKRLELNTYEDIAHLLVPVVTDANRALEVLNWLLHTMHERYETMARVGVRSIAAYRAQSEQAALDMPYIVVIIDELADLMMAAGNRLELVIARIAQMARAAGIHLIVATQRPSVDVITGLIKVNFASRLALRVTSATDSRVILDEDGAQRLIGSGDMLMRGADSSCLKRVHGAYCTSDEIARVVAHIKAQRPVLYQELGHAALIDDERADLASDPLFNQVMQFLATVDEVSISLLQRRFRIGFNRSARIIDALEAAGRIVSTDGGKIRKVVRSQ